MQNLIANFNGTGAAVYLCIGAVPISVKLTDVEASTNPLFIEWNRSMVSEVTAYGGLIMTGSTGVYTKATTAGIFPYEGGDLLTDSNQTSTAYGEGVFLGWDTKDYRADASYGTTGAAISKWTLGNSGNRTGNWNVAKVASGKIGVGSIIRIKEASSGLVKESAVVALTSDGEQANEVTLSRAIGSGDIVFLGGMYQLAPLPLGKVAPAGVYVADTTINVNNDFIVGEFLIDDAR